MGEVGLTRGKLEDALFWAAVFAAHGTKAKVRDARSALQVIVSGGNAARLAGLYFLSGPPLLEGDERIINHKLAEAVKLGAEGLSVSWEELRRTDKGLVAADLTISEAGVAVKYNVYLREKVILFQFASSDRGRVELAARLLRLAGVSAEVKKVGGSDIWSVIATTGKLAAGRGELRKAIAEIVKTSVKNGWMDADKAELWLEKLERGRVLMEGWPKYEVRPTEGAPVVRHRSTNPDNIEREAHRLREMGLVEGVHFSVKMPESGRRATSRSSGRVLSAPPGSPPTAGENSGGWWLSL